MSIDPSTVEISALFLMSKVAQAPSFPPVNSTPRPVGSDWRGGRGRRVDELVAVRFSHGLRHCCGIDAGLPRGLHYPLHSPR